MDRAPAANCDAGVAAKRNADVLEFLQSNKDAILDSGSVSYCCLHDRECPVYLKHNGAKAGATVGPAPCQPWWQESDAEWREHALKVNASGLCCTDWTVLGKRRGEAGATERWHHVWQIDREKAAELLCEDIFFAECAVSYPVEKKQKDGMAASHHVVWVKTSPHELGFPVRRSRCFSAGSCWVVQEFCCVDRAIIHAGYPA